MPKKIYQNFAEYAANDKKYLARVLSNQLTKAQSKITFADGSYYNVTRAGNRWWGKNGFLHREDGPAGVLHWGREAYYLYSIEFTKEEYEEEQKLFHFRPHFEYEFVDINPMLISVSDKEWVNPFISTWYNPEDGSEHDNDIYRIYLSNAAGDKMYVYFKSDYLDKKVEQYYSQPDWEDNKKYDLFSPPYIHCPSVYEAIDLTLTEDAWGPYPQEGKSVNKSLSEFIEWQKEDTNQFCFSSIGEVVGSFLNSEISVDFFSPDCGLTTDGKGNWWCDS